MLKPQTIPALIVILLLASCTQKSSDKGVTEVKRDSLAMFHVDSWMTFVNTNENDQIALLFKRDTLDTFKYRIELLRKWKGLPLDYGVLRVNRIESDSIFIFKGGNTDCDVEIRIYNSQGEFKIGQQYVKLKRNCKDDSLDITFEEFQKLWHK